MARFRIGIDVGGTFTDICLFNEDSKQVFVEKTSSTPEDSSLGIREGLRNILSSIGASGKEVVYLAHGTTVATNTLLQHNGARTGLITTKGFRDLLEIGRQTRPNLYDMQVDKPEPLVPRDVRLEVAERVYSDGRVLLPLDDRECREAARKMKEAGVEAVAICLLHSYVNPQHELALKSMVQEILPGAFISVSHEVMPEFREYERLSTTVVNAYLGPVVRNYVSKLGERIRELGTNVGVYITQSNGGMISLQRAQDDPVRTVLSGPSTGVIGAAHTARLAGHADIITFDMGGTSTDVCLVQNSEPHVTNLREIEGHVVKTPMIDVHTVGAGGGSIAWIDTGGHLKVGPKSAGSLPGPVCYGKGGQNVTVTDANMVLGTMNRLLGGRMAVDAEASLAALASLGNKLAMDPLDTAMGVISVVVANMVRAVRVISIQRGYDPRQFTLVAFGGAGPLHAGWIAKDLNMQEILIPERPGLECAFGILVTDLRSDFTRTKMMPLEPSRIDDMNAALADLENQGRQWLAAEGIPKENQVVRRSVDMRYMGQNYELTISMPNSILGPNQLIEILRNFYEAHERAYGYRTEGAPVQAVTFRVEAIGMAPKISIEEQEQGERSPENALIGERQVYLGRDEGGLATCSVYAREELRPGNQLAGPAIVEQMDTTTLLLRGQQATMDGYRNLIIRNR